MKIKNILIVSFFVSSIFLYIFVSLFSGTYSLSIDDVLSNEADYSLYIDTDRKLIINLGVGTEVGELLEKMPGKFKIYDKNSNLKKDDSIVVTGDILKSPEVSGQYKLSVLGDINGDGEITQNDIDDLFGYYMGDLNLSSESVSAGNVKFKINGISLDDSNVKMVLEDRDEISYKLSINNDSEIRLTDVAKLYQHLVNGLKIYDVTWRSNNTNVVRVNDGVVTSGSAGSAVVSASVDGTSASSNVSVANIRNAYDYVNTTVLTGDLRNDTAVNISKKMYPNGSDNVLVISNNDLIEGYVAQSLASAMDAPILLVWSDRLEENIISEIRRLGASNIYIIGGVGNVAKVVEDELKSNFSSSVVERIFGDNRFITAVNVAEMVQTITQSVNSVIITESVDEPVDAAMVSFVSGSKNIPILYNPKDSLFSTNSSFLSSNGNIQNVYIIGNQFSDSVINAIRGLNKTVKVVGGDNRYETNAAIINEFYSEFDSVVLANSLIDAVTSSRLTSKTNSVLLYSDKELYGSQAELVKKNANKIRNVYYLGGGNIKVTYRDLMYKINESNYKLNVDKTYFSDFLFMKNKVVFYVPHQDDETLFYSQTITSAIDRLGAENVFVVLVTDGNSSGVKYDEEISTLLNNNSLSFSAARDIEYRAALRKLGVINIQFVDKLDFISQSRFVDGTLINNLEKLKDVMKAYDNKFGGDVVHIAYTPYFDYHDDHKSLGKALTELYFDTGLNYNNFSNVYLLVRSDKDEYVVDDKYLLLLEDNSNNNKILNACEQFEENLTDPNDIRIGIGYASVEDTFNKVVANAKNKRINTKIHVPYIDS